MNLKRIAWWLVAVAVVACVAGYGLRRFEIAHDPWHEQMKIFTNPRAVGQWAFGMYRPTVAQDEEWQIMRLNLTHEVGLTWHDAMGHAMLLKANWLANRLNLPIQRPIQPWEVVHVGFGSAPSSVLPQYPSWIPDTVYGMNIYNTNIPRLKRILALKFAVNGNLDTPAYHFNFMDGQCDYIARQFEYEGEANDFDEILAAPHVHPPPLRTAEIYQIATNYLAAVDVNLDMLEKSRLPHPVRQEEARVLGASSPQPVYFVAWGTNYYGLNWQAKFLDTNAWSPSVLVEIGPHKELLELAVGDLTYYRDPPMLIPSSTVWRVVHTPDPPLEQLRNPAFTAEHFLCDPHYATNYYDYWTELANTNSFLWHYQHHVPLVMKIVFGNGYTNTYMWNHKYRQEEEDYMSNTMRFDDYILLPYPPGSATNPPTPCPDHNTNAYGPNPVPN